MYCSTCGARVPDGHTRCTNCGAPVSRPAGFGVPAVVQQQGVPLTVAVCPRCGFQGPTVGYFSQGSHVAGLILLTLFTLFPAMGFGGLLYYGLRRDHRSCARCGETLGKGAVLALTAASQHGAALPAAAAAEADMPEGGGGMAWSVGSIFFFVMSAILILAGLGDGEPVAVMFGLLFGGGGGFLLKRARAAREERRQSLLVALQQPVLRLAGDRAGRLTVTEVASTLGWPMRRAEKVLNSLDDGLRVVSDITPEGVIVYEFRELRHTQQQRLSAEEVDSLLSAGPVDSHLPLQGQPLPQAQPVAPQQQPGDGTLRA